jgi:hypothetical protein
MIYYFTLDVEDVGSYGGGVVRPTDIMRWALSNTKLNSNLRLQIL